MGPNKATINATVYMGIRRDNNSDFIQAVVDGRGEVFYDERTGQDIGHTGIEIARVLDYHHIGLEKYRILNGLRFDSNQGETEETELPDANPEGLKKIIDAELNRLHRDDTHKLKW